MNRVKLILLFVPLFLCIGNYAQNNYVSKVWVADNGDGTYKNPIINADYSDPDVCRVGDDYYMTASSFGCAPAIPILHSYDLVNWRLVNYAMKRVLPDDVFSKPMHGKGVWAPCIRFHNNEFFIFWGDPDYGIYMIKTKNPEGDWTEPILVLPGKGLIDPSPLWDDDGRVFLVHGWAASRAGLNSILTVNELNADASKVIGETALVYDGIPDGNFTTEGPKFYKRNGYYYIMAPAGGVEQGWQIALRSKNVYGPYECRTVMAQGKTSINGPHQGGWVETQTGESWFMNFQDKGAYGRVIHLQPMKWVNNWPVIGVDKDGDGCGEPVLSYKKPNVGKTYPIETPVESDEFNSEKLGLQWQWHANPKQSTGMPSRLGFMRLYAEFLPEDYVNFWQVPNLLLQKMPTEEFAATTKVDFYSKTTEEKTGLIVMGWDYSYLALVKKENGFELQQSTCIDAEQKSTETILATKSISESKVYLRVEVKNGAICTFSYGIDGTKFIPFGQPFRARQGKWIGAKVGIFCLNPLKTGTRGYADFDWFHIDKNN
ncbi:MAG: glycoside hydrolase 43 family protein [Paludibacter sp.]|nr:glycoside hydrolase 43 family protein [Paludibacter sp.]